MGKRLKPSERLYQVASAIYTALEDLPEGDARTTLRILLEDTYDAIKEVKKEGY